MTVYKKTKKERDTHFLLSRSFLCWSAVTLLMGSLLLIMPYALNIRVFLESHLGSELGHIPEILFLLLGLIFAAGIILRPELQKATILIKIAVLLVIYMFSLKFLTQYPIERFHYIEYSLLACFVYFAWNERTSRIGLFVKTFVTAGALGLTEEFIQGFVPGRSANAEDMFTNAFAVLLGVISSDMVITKLFPKTCCSTAKKFSAGKDAKIKLTDERFD